MVHALVIWMTLFLSPERFVGQTVDTISVVHIKDGADLIFFWDFVQGEWACLDHRWLTTDMALSFDDRHWNLFWHDDNDSCWRLMKATHWIESWEDESPLAGQHNRPWFARLLAPGLAN